MTKCVLSADRVRDFAAEIFDIEQTYPHEYEAIVARIANEGAEAQRKADESMKRPDPGRPYTKAE